MAKNQLKKTAKSCQKMAKNGQKMSKMAKIKQELS